MTSDTPELANLASTASTGGKITCLGLEFASDADRRAHFTEELRKKLADPEFRAISGFPQGKDEDILALSDPPYYTACPNPWLADFIAEWESQKPATDQPYHREPFAADVSEGKNDPIYNAHSYHTKVPHKAIMRYILHYTDPGDIVFDGFCGTGMTGVAAQMCGDEAVVRSLGYDVRGKDIYHQEETTDGKKEWKKFSKLGARHAVLNDLSPAATFIAYNYNTPVDVQSFRAEAEEILQEVEAECGWMYETQHADGVTTGRINYTVWSDVFVCPSCNGEVIFYEAAVDKNTMKVSDEFPCPHCNSQLTKRTMQRAWESKTDVVLQETIQHVKQKPVLINYSVPGMKGKFEKTPEEKDLTTIGKIEKTDIPYWYPTNEILKGDKTGDPLKLNITHAHHFYTKRNLYILSAIRNRCISRQSFLWFNSQLVNISKLNRYRPGVSFPYNPLNGTLYIGSQISESSVFIAYENKLKKLLTAFKSIKQPSLIETQSMANQKDMSVDYIFIDPPFGANIMYSELNFLWESWGQVSTNKKPEAIENKSQQKGAEEYRHLMFSCFKEAYRILKPGRWMTVEFSNTRASVWNSIQTALSDAGFIVANVSALDKQQGSFNAVTSTTAVRQDLVISAYKPNGGFEERFEKVKTQEEGIWEFVRSHLSYLPIVKYQGGQLHAIPERDPRIIYDKLIAYYVRKDLSVPISSHDFQEGLASRFASRDGMFFLAEQVGEYDKKRVYADSLGQESLFVDGEASAIQWLRRTLKDKPQSFQDLHPQFLQEIEGWKNNEVMLELSTLLEQNFLKYDGESEVPSQIHAYLSSNWSDLRKLDKNHSLLRTKAKDRWYVPDLNKAEEIEKLREKSLLKEFGEYKKEGKKLKQFRMEAILAGFKDAWAGKDYATILAVAELLPRQILEEDSQLLMYYDHSRTRLSED